MPSCLNIQPGLTDQRIANAFMALHGNVGQGSFRLWLCFSRPMQIEVFLVESQSVLPGYLKSGYQPQSHQQRLGRVH